MIGQLPSQHTISGHCRPAISLVLRTGVSLSGTKCANISIPFTHDKSPETEEVSMISEKNLYNRESIFHLGIV